MSSKIKLFLQSHYFIFTIALLISFLCHVFARSEVATQENNIQNVVTVLEIEPI